MLKVRGNSLLITIFVLIGCLMSRPAHAEAVFDSLPGKTLPTFKFEMEKQDARIFEGGSAREAGEGNFPISKGIAGVSMYLKPGGLRELHWHANAAEWAYVIKGHCRVRVIVPAG